MFSHRFILAFFIAILGFVYCQNNDLDVDDIKKNLEKSVQEIPGLEDLNNTNLPSQEELEKLLKEKCEKNGGGEDAFLALKNQQSAIQECVQQQINSTVIQAEIEKAKETGSMDEVLGKYCKKYPEIYQCFETVTHKAKECLDDDEKKTMDKLLALTNDLKEFVCFKDGDRIAMFIAEGGFECLDMKKDELQACANQTIGARLPTEGLSLTNMPTFLFSQKDCDDLQTIRTCFITEMEKCKDTTPANIMDAFFKFLKKHTPCNDMPVTKVQKGPAAVESPNSASHNHTLSIFILFTISVFSKFF